MEPPGRVAVAKPPFCFSVAKLPAHVSVAEPPGRVAVAELPGRASVAKLPVRASVAKPPGRASVAEPLGWVAGAKFPNPFAAEPLPESVAVAACVTHKDSAADNNNSSTAVKTGAVPETHTPKRARGDDPEEWKTYITHTSYV
jgi:hypothetical protein